MKPRYVLAATLSLLFAGGNLAIAQTPQIPTGKLTPVTPVQKQPLQQESLTGTQKKSLKQIARARVRPLRATHSGRPTQDWCTGHNASTISGRVDVTYNFPGPSDGPTLPGVLIVNSNGREYRTDVTIYPGTNKTAISDSVDFRWQDACPPHRVGVRLTARSPEDKQQFMPVTLYASPDRLDGPTWY